MEVGALAVVGPADVASQRPWIGQRSPGNRLLGDDLFQTLARSAGAGVNFVGAVLVGEECGLAQQRRLLKRLAIGKREWLVGRRDGCAFVLAGRSGDGVERVRIEGIGKAALVRRDVADVLEGALLVGLPTCSAPWPSVPVFVATVMLVGCLLSMVSTTMLQSCPLGEARVT